MHISRKIGCKVFAELSLEQLLVRPIAAAVVQKRFTEAERIGFRNAPKAVPQQFECIIARMTAMRRCAVSPFLNDVSVLADFISHVAAAFRALRYHLHL